MTSRASSSSDQQPGRGIARRGHRRQVGEVVAGLRAWAAGSYPIEAGVELLVRSCRGRFTDPGWPWILPGTRAGAWFLDASVIPECSIGLSGGERRVLAVVAALIDSAPLHDLPDVLAGVDREHLGLIVAAFAHAGGSHEHSETVITDDRVAFFRLPALAAWPPLPPEAA
ncbi:MAG TPA: hypothetical protein PLL54_02525 [Dermatophilaceae bacterium]|nr:hypothetical protein [Dermatophilaceae bacterium]